MGSARAPYRLEELSWPEAQAALQAGAMAVIPVGSLEQHGRHLALNTDNVLGDAIAEAAVREAAGRGLKVLYDAQKYVLGQTAEQMNPSGGGGGNGGSSGLGQSLGMGLGILGSLGGKYFGQNPAQKQVNAGQISGYGY